jgi:hypothetical protein
MTAAAIVGLEGAGEGELFVRLFSPGGGQILGVNIEKSPRV